MNVTVTEELVETLPKSNGVLLAGCSATALPLASLAVAAIALAAWQFLPPLFSVPKYIIPQLSDLWTEGVRMWQDDNLVLHFLSTASMAILVFILGSLLGAFFGYALGLLPAWEKVLSP